LKRAPWERLDVTAGMRYNVTPSPAGLGVCARERPVPSPTG
jgi:hypothetical protein